MRTEIKLNDVYYKLRNLPLQSLANQMASKVGQGQSSYGDLTTWSAWIQENWQEGSGRLRPHRQGGFLYGEMDSRVPEQLILPGLVYQVDTRDVSGVAADCRYMPTNSVGVVQVGAASVSWRAAAMRITTPAALEATHKYWFYMNVPVGVEVTIGIYNNSGNLPTTVVTSATYTPPETHRGFYWHGVELPGSGTLSTATTYWLVVYPTANTVNTIEIAYGDTGWDLNVRRLHATSGWVPESGITAYLWFTSDLHIIAGTTATNTGSGFFRFADDTGVTNLYHYVRGHIYKYDEANDQWDNLGDSGLPSINSAISFPVSSTQRGVFLGTEDPSSGYTILLDDETFDPQVVVYGNGAGVFGATLFAKAAGYLWMAQNNKLFYMEEDGTSHTTDEMQVGSFEFTVTGMAGMGDSMYVATAEALYRIAPGDFAVGVAPWNSNQEDNGRSIVNHQGALYATANNRVVRITEDHQFQDVWMTREEDLAAGRIGKVWSLCNADNWLVALVGSTTSGNKPTIWAMQGNSWHHIATLPSGESESTDTGVNYSIYYDRVTHNIWASTPDCLTYRIEVPEFATNPYNDTSIRYMPAAWMEWDWFDSPVMEAPKDYESVAIIGENISSARPVTVYWKDDASTAWELLGVVTSNYQELRWTIASGTRPDTRRFKLGILVSTTSGSQTPRIRAIRVKYHLMVRDWFRWSFQVDVSGRAEAYQMLADGTVNNLTHAQIKSNLDALAKRTSPFLYQDVDGKLYEVKVANGDFPYTLYEYTEATTTEYWEGAYNLTVEQITQGEYTP